MSAAAIAADRGLPLEAWRGDGHDGRDVRVALLDSGVDAGHPALAGRIGGTAVFDRRGYPAPSDTMRDATGHGTYTAGLVAAIAPGAELFAAQVIEGGATIWRLLAGIDWALERGASLLVMPLGFRGHHPVLRNALGVARRAGALPVAAIGNAGAGRVMSPGCLPEVLAVGACDACGSAARFSGSTAPDASVPKPDVLAHGVGLLGPAPGGGQIERSGTSGATALAAGAIAVLSQATGASPLAVAAALCATARALPAEQSHRAAFGILDAAAAAAATREARERDEWTGSIAGHLSPALRARLAHADPDARIDVIASASDASVADTLSPLADTVTGALPRLNALRLRLNPTHLREALSLCPEAVFAPANPLAP